MICAVPFMMLVMPLPGAQPTVDDIICRVAENQQRAEAARAAFVYDMNVFVRLKRANGKLAREESRDYVVAPGAKGSARKLVKLEGTIQEGNKAIRYTTAKYQVKKMDIDGAVADSFAKELLWRKNSEGPMVGWFPLTAKKLEHYSFALEGEEKYRDMDVYKVSYSENEEEDCGWRGEVLVERTEFQPVLVSSQWICKIPTAVKVMLGTNVQQVGARITYQRFDKNVWFPVVAGGEMKVRVLFLYARTIAFSAKNSNFHKADVTTSIQYADVEDEDKDSK